MLNFLIQKKRLVHEKALGTNMQITKPYNRLIEAENCSQLAAMGLHELMSFKVINKS